MFVEVFFYIEGRHKHISAGAGWRAGGRACARGQQERGSGNTGMETWMGAGHRATLRSSNGSRVSCMVQHWFRGSCTAQCSWRAGLGRRGAGGVSIGLGELWGDTHRVGRSCPPRVRL